MTKRTLALLGLMILTPAAGMAQVGYEPRKSPYRDLEHRQELTFLGGHFKARVDPARVAPVSGPAFGAHYEFRMTGPAYFTANTMLVVSERRVIDPTKLIAERDQGVKSVTMLLTDIGFALNLTGFKSWHGLVPSLGGGLGMGAGFDSPDVGGYKFGYPFVLTFRPSIKFAPKGNWQGRIDATNYFYRIRYPDSYFTKSTADPTVLDLASDRNVWTRNLGLTAGITYSFGR
ncbi:MAG TPA: hypothetical protein PKC83_17680 [Gemmatimonadaceae bacterium]|nr:MAG: hypothetical protein ABS52_16870 [Gemmatimonadetes bacterium SCN 70-22]HMN10612.1 hypothetical protein [Gemmatimonadaceae bacterium]